MISLHGNISKYCLQIEQILIFLFLYEGFHRYLVNYGSPHRPILCISKQYFSPLLSFYVPVQSSMYTTIYCLLITWCLFLAIILSVCPHKCCTEIRTHIGITKNAFQKLYKVLRHRKSSLETKKNGDWVAIWYPSFYMAVNIW